MKQLVPAIPSFIISLAKQASEIRILDHVATFTTSTVVGEDQNEVLHLDWVDKNLPMSTVFSEENLRDGFWVGNKLVCPDYDGEVTYLHFLKDGTFLHPIVDLQRDLNDIPSLQVLIAGLEAVAHGHVPMGNLPDLAIDLRESASNEGCEEGLTVVDANALHALLQEVTRMKALRESIQEMSTIAKPLVQCRSTDLLSRLFPVQYQALLELHELNAVSELNMGYDWEYLTPALTKVSQALGYVEKDQDKKGNIDADSVDDVVEHVRSLEEKYGFKVDAASASEAVQESADLLNLHLSEEEVAEAVSRLLEEADAEDPEENTI